MSAHVRDHVMTAREHFRRKRVGVWFFRHFEAQRQGEINVFLFPLQTGNISFSYFLK